MVLECMSQTAQDNDSERAKTLALEAVNLFETQAEIEKRLELTFLQHRREKRANTLRDGGVNSPSDSHFS